MLVLSRKKDEQIVLQVNGQTVLVRVVAIDGNKVRLGITAPDDITVHREEVWKRRNEFVPPPAPTSPAPPTPPIESPPRLPR